MNPLASPHGRATLSESAPSPFVSLFDFEIFHILSPLLSDVGARTEEQIRTKSRSALDAERLGEPGGVAIVADIASN